MEAKRQASRRASQLRRVDADYEDKLRRRQTRPVNTREVGSVVNSSNGAGAARKPIRSKHAPTEYSYCTTQMPAKPTKPAKLAIPAMLLTIQRPTLNRDSDAFSTGSEHTGSSESSTDSDDTASTTDTKSTRDTPGTHSKKKNATNKSPSKSGRKRTKRSKAKSMFKCWSIMGAMFSRD